MRLLFVVGAVLMLNACGAYKFTLEEQQMVSDISINDNVWVAPRIDYHGKEEKAMGFGGSAMGIAGQIKGNVTQNQLEDALKDNNISIADMTLEKLTQELKKIDFFAGKMKKSGADFTISAQVNSVGLHTSGTFSRRLYPIFETQITITDAQGTVLWKGYGRTGTRDDSPDYHKNHLLKEPEKYREMMQYAVDLSVERAIELLQDQLEAN